MKQCPACKKNIIDLSEDGTPRLRSKIILFGEHGAEAKCPSCGHMVSVPIKLDMKVEKGKGPLIHYIRADKAR